MSSSVIPSLKYSLPPSALTLVKGRTASDRTLGDAALRPRTTMSVARIATARTAPRIRVRRAKGRNAEDAEDAEVEETGRNCVGGADGSDVTGATDGECGPAVSALRDPA